MNHFISAPAYLSALCSRKQDADAFNAPIGDWDVSNVDNMENMFSGAIAFNQVIGAWDVAEVITMDNMFNGASDFNQNLSFWEADALTTCADFALNAADWLAAYDGSIAGKNPPLSATLIAAGCQ